MADMRRTTWKASQSTVPLTICEIPTSVQEHFPSMQYRDRLCSAETRRTPTSNRFACSTAFILKAETRTTSLRRRLTLYGDGKILRLEHVTIKRPAVRLWAHDPIQHDRLSKSRPQPGQGHGEHWYQQKRLEIGFCGVVIGERRDQHTADDTIWKRLGWNTFHSMLPFTGLLFVGRNAVLATVL